ncbi:MAG: hemerythrin domain-containing protein [Candidatus Sulfotelmatobacter sp.]
MAVQSGAKSHPFSNPTALLSDCHRRIEMFLGSLQRVGEFVDQPLSKDARSALQSALRYFREAAPKHTADEEQSLFPRLRQAHLPIAENAILALEALECEHQQANNLHAEVNSLGIQCLEYGPLSLAGASRFQHAISELAKIHKEHIRVEDEVVFPAADQILSGGEKAASRP